MGFFAPFRKKKVRRSGVGAGAWAGAGKGRPGKRGRASFCGVQATLSASSARVGGAAATVPFADEVDNRDGPVRVQPADDTQGPVRVQPAATNLAFAYEASDPPAADEASDPDGPASATLAVADEFSDPDGPASATLAVADHFSDPDGPASATLDVADDFSDTDGPPASTLPFADELSDRDDPPASTLPIADELSDRDDPPAATLPFADEVDNRDGLVRVQPAASATLAIADELSDTDPDGPVSPPGAMPASSDDHPDGPDMVIEMLQHLRMLGRKDPAAKVKALSALSMLFAQKPGEEVAQIVPQWDLGKCIAGILDDISATESHLLETACESLWRSYLETVTKPEENQEESSKSDREIELELVIKTLQMKLIQTENYYKEKVEGEIMARTNLEKQLSTLKQKMNSSEPCPVPLTSVPCIPDVAGTPVQAMLNSSHARGRRPRRKKQNWDETEEEFLREAVAKFYREGRQIPWCAILKYGKGKFNRKRVPDDLMRKWKRM